MNIKLHRQHFNVLLIISLAHYFQEIQEPVELDDAPQIGFGHRVVVCS